jgi:hypothetical protein
MAGPDLTCLPTHRACVMRFVCVNCTATGQLSGSRLFLHLAGVCRNISASTACFAADLSFKEIHVEARSGDVMAGAGAAAGPAPYAHHQTLGTQFEKYNNYGIDNNDGAITLVKAAQQSVQGSEFKP